MIRGGRYLPYLATRAIRRYLVGPEQRWIFNQPSPGWTPPPVERTSLYLHVPFCRHFCPYCPYTKVPYQNALIEPFTRAAIAEADWWADAVGPAEVTSIYIGGGTPTLALDSVAEVLAHVRKRFHLTGDICIETNPADVNADTVQQLHDIGVRLVSLGVESFQSGMLSLIGRDYPPAAAERALARLAQSGFASINADFMFALPGQSAAAVISDLNHAMQLGADQITAYPLFTFPYTSVGKYMRLAAVRMPDLSVRRAHYLAISSWCAQHGFERVSVWGFKRSHAPRYSSVTRDGYIGIGPGAGSHLPNGFVLNTFDLNSWINSACRRHPTVALHLPFAAEMSGWWWLYWRFYDTDIPMDQLTAALGNDAPKARRWLKIIEKAGMAKRSGSRLRLTDTGAFWLHLAQNYFALNYVNTLWTQARRAPWPESVSF